MLYYSKHVFTIELTRVVAFVHIFSSDAFRLSSITIDRTIKQVPKEPGTVFISCVSDSENKLEVLNLTSVHIPLTYSITLQTVRLF